MTSPSLGCSSVLVAVRERLRGFSVLARHERHLLPRGHQSLDLLHVVATLLRALFEVVHLIGQLGRGGTERQLCLLLRHSDPERFAHRVVVFNPSRHAPWNRELQDAGVEVLEVPVSCRGVPRRLAYLLARRLQTVHESSLRLDDLEDQLSAVRTFAARVEEICRAADKT